MSIMDKFFGSGARHASQQMPQNLPTPGNIPQGAAAPQSGTAGTAPNGVTPPGATDPQKTQTQQTENKSPFAEFEKMWEPPTGADGKPLQVTSEPLYNVDPQKVMEAAQKTNFKDVATPELLAKVAAGGQEGVAAMMEIMQSVASSVYANSAVAATKIAEQGITKALSQAEQRLPTVIRQQQLSEALAAKNPALQNPAVRPMVEMLKNQMSQKYPNASTAELQDMAERYMLSAAEAFNPEKANKQNQEVQQVKKENEDWDKFFNLATGNDIGF